MLISYSENNGDAGWWQEGERQMSNFFFTLAIVCLSWGVISSLIITAFVYNRGVKINILLYKIMVFKYIHHYYKITKNENGKPGLWFYSYVTAMSLALAFAIIGMALKST